MASLKFMKNSPSLFFCGFYCGLIVSGTSYIIFMYYVILVPCAYEIDATNMKGCNWTIL